MSRIILLVTIILSLFYIIGEHLFTNSYFTDFGVGPINYVKPGYSDEQLADAIYRAEGGAKAQYLYGIRSVHYADEAEARKICLNTIRNQRHRHGQGACPDSVRGSSHDYLTCLWHRYCPPSAHELNRHWLKNVKHFLGE